MSCTKILDSVYEGGESMSLLRQIRIGLHILACPDCAQAIERFEVTRDILHQDFLPPSPGFEHSVMAIIAAEEGETLAALEAEEAKTPGGLSTRGWAIAGLIILVSLATVFFGIDFNKVAGDQLRRALYRQPPKRTKRALWPVGNGFWQWLQGNRIKRKLKTREEKNDNAPARAKGRFSRGYGE